MQEAHSSKYAPEASQRVGRNRPTVLQRRVNCYLSLKERKIRSEEMKAEALMLLAKSKRKTIVTEEDEEFDEDEGL